MILTRSIIQFSKSPSLTSWFNLFAKTSTILIILPLVNNYFSEIDRFVWFTITTFWSIILLMDFGLNPTVTRYFSYLSGKGNLSNIIDSHDDFGLGDVNMLIENISKIYNWIVFAVILFVLPLVTFSIYEKISTDRLNEYLLLLCFSCISSTLYLKSNVYNGVLQGLGYLPKVQLIQGTIALISCLFTVISIVFSKSLFWTIVSFYIPFCCYFFVIKKVSNKPKENSFKQKENNNFIKLKQKFRKRIISDAWKSGAGVLASQGFILAATLLINRFESIYVATSFMLSLQLIRAVSSYSQVPFYSLIPHYCRLYAEEKISELRVTLAKRFFLSISLYLLITIIVSYAVFNEIGTFFFGSSFEEQIWLYFVLAYFFERVGALLLQIYTITGDVKWHLVNGGAALLSFLLLIFLRDYFDAYILIFVFGLSYVLWVIPISIFLILRRSRIFLT